MFGLFILDICCEYLQKREYAHENIHRLEGTVDLLRIDFFITDSIFPEAQIIYLPDTAETEMKSGTYQILVTVLGQIQIQTYSYETNILKFKLNKYMLKYCK